MKYILTITATMLFASLLNGQPVKVMLITGGHAYDTLQFFQLFDSLEGVEYEHHAQPEANRKLAEGTGEKFDAFVFYDMWQEVSAREKQAYMDLTKEGKPFLFLHHALVSYQNWPDFEQIIGGKYMEKSPGIPPEQLSSYRHDVWVDIEVTHSRHPVTKGLNHFRLFDEVYGNFRVLDGVKPLLQTKHPESTPVIGWENRFNHSTIIYLQPGHDFHSFESAEYRKLILNSIRYLTQPMENK
ncbi:MAG: ThuA domain-containing protein [Mariniphaga sp.]|nr:ThuA domain-containing protein [Mariniphaga sp.]MDD4424923.1 ThuA domain-containing protein [Mariniphaga sp.]